MLAFTVAVGALLLLMAALVAFLKKSSMPGGGAGDPGQPEVRGEMAVLQLSLALLCCLPAALADPFVTHTHTCMQALGMGGPARGVNRPAGGMRRRRRRAVASDDEESEEEVRCAAGLRSHG